MNWTCNCSLYNTLVLVVGVAGRSAMRTLVVGRLATRTWFGTLVAGHSATWFWIVNLNFFGGKTYCRGGSRLNRPYKYLFVGAAGTIAAPTNRFVGAAGNTSRPYKLICRDGCSTSRPYQRVFVGAVQSRTAPTVRFPAKKSNFQFKIALPNVPQPTFRTTFGLPNTPWPAFALLNTPRPRLQT